MLATLLTLLLQSAVPIAAPPPIHVTLDRHITRAPATFRVWLHIIRHDLNHTVCIYVSGGDYESSSCLPHTATDLSQRSIVLTRLPSGDYEFWAVLHRSNRTAYASSHVLAHVTP